MLFEARGHDSDVASWTPDSAVIIPQTLTPRHATFTPPSALGLAQFYDRQTSSPSHAS
jgi:hypothetical protein